MSNQGFDRLKNKLVMMDMLRTSGMDGFANSAANLGGASLQMSSGSFFRSNLTADILRLTMAYRENWLAMRIIDTPAEDMTRAWYSLSTRMEKEDLDDLARLEAVHSVKQEITNAIRWALLYGGSLALMVVHDFHKLDEPLDKDSILPGSFQGLMVIDRTAGIEPSMELVQDIYDPDYGLPEYYTISNQEGLIKIHHSRVLRFIGRELPQTETEREQYWGASELEHVWDELININSIGANIAKLVFRANLTALKMNDLTEMLNIGTLEKKEEVYKIMSLENELRSSFGIQLLNQNDSMETFSYNFAGLSDIYEQFMTVVAGAAEIPATKLFGRSPQGMNATGESDMQNYYERISSLQERMLRPALERLLPVMALSCWGFDPKDMIIRFEPIRPMSAEEKIRLAREETGMVLDAYDRGVITREEVRDILRSTSGQMEIWSKLKNEKEGKGNEQRQPD